MLDLALDLRVGVRPAEVRAKTGNRDEDGADERDPDDPWIPVARYRDLELRCSSHPSACSYWVAIQTGVRTSMESTEIDR
jgi:hypothetical protein